MIRRVSYPVLIVAFVLLSLLSVWALEWPHYSSNNINCVDCHALHSGGMGRVLIPRGAEQEAMCKSCHNPTGVASAKSAVANHKNASGVIIADCGSCHDPHGPSVTTDPHPGGVTAPNLKLIREDTNFFVPGALTPAIFQARPNHFAFDDFSAPWNGICQSCHTQTSHHRKDGSADHTHNVHSAEACTACHLHENGFVPGCKNCHNQPQPQASPRRRQIVFNETTQQNGDFELTSHHVAGDAVDSDCTACHYMNDHKSGIVKLKDPDQGKDLVYEFDPNAPSGIENFCLNCHDADGAQAGGGTRPFSDGRTVPNVAGIPGSRWADSAHKQRGYALNGGSPVSCLGNGTSTGCHGNAHGSANEKLLSAGGGVQPINGFCFNCHAQGKVQNAALSNNRPGGYVSATDVQTAFGKSRKHDVGSAFTVNSSTYTLQCTTCHNPHVVTGKYWEADQGYSPVTRPNLTADPLTNPRAMGSTLWGAVAGQKMEDFAARGGGSGGWYFSKARGGVISFDQPAAYQPPKAGSDYTFEFFGDVLPDFPTLCLDCHTYRMGNYPPVNWGQGIGCTGNSVDPPDQRIECGAQHGLGAANKPSAWGDVAGFYGSGGNPDPIFNEPLVTRGRGATHFNRWPYEPADRNAGVNFVLSCTDCHEAHGSNRGGMIRERFNVTDTGGCGTGSGGANCADGGNWNSFCNACHYYYGSQHDGMSCGNASCHEANSIHRIIKNTSSGGTSLWTEPSRPTTTPEIASVYGQAGSNQLTVFFTQGVYGGIDGTGALTPSRFVLTDIGGNNPKTITGVTHTPGDSTAIITMSAPLASPDLRNDIIATSGVSVWNAAGVPAGPWPVSIPSGCPASTSFQFNEPAGSTVAQDVSGMLLGTVNDPAGTFPGDGYFYGDGVDNYIDFENNDRCLKASTAMTIEARIKPSGLEGTTNYIRRILGRTSSNHNYQMSVWRNNSTFPGYYNAPAGVASIALWVNPADTHGGQAWKPALTDYQACPIVSDHWYLVKAVWNSAKSGGIPADIFVDDQGTDGNGAGENWAGYKNCTDSDQLQLPPDRYLYAGDQIIAADGDFTIGTEVNNHANNLFYGLIDWITWQASVDYSGVDDPPNPPP